MKATSIPRTIKGQLRNRCLGRVTGGGGVGVGVVGGEATGSDVIPWAEGSIKVVYQERISYCNLDALRVLYGYSAGKKYTLRNKNGFGYSFF